VPEPLIPAYERSLAALVPALFGLSDRSWLPGPASEGGPVVLLVLDGLGWNQFSARAALMPTLAGFSGGAVSTVAPSTTAAALTSITTGTTPGEHGIVGYRMRMAGEILNSLRWTVNGADARARISPEATQPIAPFAGFRPPVVSRSDFATSGFTRAHQAGSRQVGWRVPSSMVVETAALLRSGVSFVYAYYDGIDKVAHEYGLSDHYDAELRYTDNLVAQLFAAMPSGATLVVTADHGQVDVGQRIVTPPESLLGLVQAQSGEGRFRWWHARAGQQQALLDAARGEFSHLAWVVSLEQVRDEGWLGERLSAAAVSRLGDVALVPFEPVAFFDPDDSGPFELQSRHGSLTADEMLVPLLAARAG
jgi:predicted AlkP superfamily pyrophosphatase or phosphodiesterase